MNWAAFALLAGYIGVCEVRAPNPWAACDARWNVALGVLIPSPLQGAIPAAGRMLGFTRRRRADPDAADAAVDAWLRRKPEEPKS